MHEKFRESWKAAGYVASGLKSDFPGSMLEVAFHYRDRVEQTVCTAKDVGHVIERYCQKFPMATVYYHGVGGYECVAQLRCHCGHEKSRGCCRDGNHHRAKVLVTLATADKERVLPGAES